MVPKDGLIASSLAAARLRTDALPEARTLFEALSRQHGHPEAWAGLATCAHLQGDSEAARSALAEALRCTVPTPTLQALAMAIAGDDWCGLTVDGQLRLPAGASVRVDGARQPGPTPGLPPAWRHAHSVDVETPTGPALGSPLPVARFAGVEGFVEGEARGIRGWAWYPADPAREPVLTLKGPHGVHQFRATSPVEELSLHRPLARPRGFRLTAAEVAALGVPLSIQGPDGRHLLGSPLDPTLEARAAADPAHAGFTPVWADVMGPPPQPSKIRPPIDIVMPVYRGVEETLACLDSVLASLSRGTRVIVIDDASPEPALVAALDRLARRRRITLHRSPENRGFPAAANIGVRLAAGRDVVVLNSDTLVPPGWLERLRSAAYSAPDIGTATPLTNDGTILSFPDPSGGNPIPDQAGTNETDTLAQKANANATADLPVGVGFCIYLRRDCLDDLQASDPFREDLFAQGYGEENDLCLRARARGWRSVAALGVFVTHIGATSFGAARAHLIRRNSAILARLHPGYDALVARHIADDPLQPARFRMDALRWMAARKPAGAVILITHAGGGGVDRVIAARAHKITQGGQRAIILRPHRVKAGEEALRVEQPGELYPNLVFAIPGELLSLARLLRRDRPERIELHHLLGHHHRIIDLADRLGIPYDSIVHDYARFCPRIALVSTERRYCGEPDVAGCEACIDDLGSLLEDDPAVPILLARSAGELDGAARVIAPSADAASRIARHFPSIQPFVEPWGDDTALPTPMPMNKMAIRRVVIIGAIGVEKGFDVLLGCARDARARSLPLEFVVAGYTSDDARLMRAGPIFVTGEYDEADAVALIQAQKAQLAFIPSLWPESWCFALTRAWEARLGAAVFDLGAQAERVRATGRGWLIPLGLGARALNDLLLRLAPLAPSSQSWPKQHSKRNDRDTRWPSTADKTDPARSTS